MFIRPIGLLFAVMLLAPAARAAECQKTASGDAFATGQAATSAMADSVALRRINAERGAFLDALANLKACLGAKAKSVTGWSISAVRYFDSDPIVEVDAVARFQDVPVVTVLGSAPANVSKDGAKESIDHVRIKTTRAAVLVARRDAKEALDAVFPSTGTPGTTKKTLSGALRGCATGEVSYWDDGAVSVKISCGKGVDAKDKPETKPQPVVGQHAPSK